MSADRVDVGPAVPSSLHLRCSYSPLPRRDGDYCGATPTTHGFIDESASGVDVDDLVHSFACAAHAQVLRDIAFTTHDVGGDCGMPGSFMQWRYEDGQVISWCSYPDEDPTLTVQMHEALPEAVAR